MLFCVLYRYVIKNSHKKSLQFRWHRRCSAMVLWTTNFRCHWCSIPMKCEFHGAETPNIAVRFTD